MHFLLSLTITLYEYLNDFCINYLNDIFIYNNNLKQNKIYVFKVLKRLLKVNFYLNINKCEFNIIKINFIKLIIIVNKIKINIKKFKIIAK